jgi:LmbE family N-acetylglucosaminyl deacetylase
MSDDSASTRTIDLARAGPDEGAWAAALDDLEAFRWPRAARLVVVSPHPDDETLGAGGLIAMAAARGMGVTVLAVTDGEASHPDPGTARRRCAELCAATEALGAGAITVRRLRLPDGDVRRHAARLARSVADLLEPDDLVVCPLPDDGHPDHEAVADATSWAARERSVHLRAFAVWAWHCHAPATSSLRAGERLWLSVDGRRRKRAAFAAYSSQLDGDDPVVPASMLVRLDRDFEVFVRLGAQP